MLCYGCLKILYKVSNFGKDDSCFVFVSKWFCYMRVIQDFFQDGIDYSLVDSRAYLLEDLPRSVWVLFANNKLEFTIYLINLVVIALSLFFFFICMVVIGTGFKSSIISHTFFSLGMAYIRLAYYGQFSNLQSFSCLLFSFDFLVIVILFHYFINV